MKLETKLTLPALARESFSYEVIERGDVFSCVDGIVYMILCIVRNDSSSNIATVRALCGSKIYDIPEGIFSLKIKDKLINMCKLAN